MFTDEDINLTNLQQQLSLRYATIHGRFAVIAVIAALLHAVGQLVLQRHYRQGNREDKLVMDHFGLTRSILQFILSIIWLSSRTSSHN